MTREEAQAIYRAGEETVVRVLVDLSVRVDQLTADFVLLKAENLALRVECGTLRERVHTLEGHVAKDSSNSHKPPSSDGLAKPSPKSLRAPSQRPSGGQLGHAGHTLRMVETPDRIVTHRVQRCSACGQSLDTVQPARVERRQVHDLPEPKLEITEHQAEIKTCSCGCVNRATFPPEAPAPVQYGPRLKGTAVYLSQYQLLPFERTSEILRDLHGCESFSQGTLANFHVDCAARLEPTEAAILKQVAASPVVGFDETGVRASGSLHWLHTVCTKALTWYYAHKKRGTQAMDAAGILPTFQGCAIHDFWKPYFSYDCQHALCNAHLLRELVFLHEQENQTWAKAMIDHLLAIKNAVATARSANFQAIPDTEKVLIHARYNRIVNEGYTENPRAEPPSGLKRRGRRKQSKALNLLDRFREHSQSILAFLYDFAVPFDNNQSERDLRMMKVRQKISGTFRSLDALKNFCRIRGYVSTARKNRLTAHDALRRIFLGDPFLPTPNSS